MNVAAMSSITKESPTTKASLTTKVKLGALLIAGVAGIAAPYVLAPFTVSILTLGLIFGLFAMSIDLMGGFGGLVSLGQAGIFATSAYGVGYMASSAGAGHGQQILVGMAAGMAITAVFAAMAIRTSEVYFLMVTMAQGMIVWGFATRSTFLGAENGLRGISRPQAVSAYWKYYYVCLAVLVLCGGLMWLIVRSPFGLSLQGLKGSEPRLQMLGYNPIGMKFYIFMLSGVFASASGILYAYYNEFVSPSTATFLTSGKGVLMAILGGIGTLVGPIIGALIIVFFENIVSIYVARWPTLLGLIFILIILFARKGIVGAVAAAWTRMVSTDHSTQDSLPPDSQVDSEPQQPKVGTQ